MVELLDLPSDMSPIICPKPIDYPVDVFATVATVIHNKIVLCGGQGYEGGATKKCHTFHPNNQTKPGTEPQNGAWQSFPSLQIVRGYSAAAVLDSDVWWVTGGYSGKQATNKTEKYQISSGRWRFGPDLPIPLYRDPQNIVPIQIHHFPIQWS